MTVKWRLKYTMTSWKSVRPPTPNTLTRSVHAPFCTFRVTVSQKRAACTSSVPAMRRPAVSIRIWTAPGTTVSCSMSSFYAAIGIWSDFPSQVISRHLCSRFWFNQLTKWLNSNKNTHKDCSFLLIQFYFLILYFQRIFHFKEISFLAEQKNYLQ